MTPEEAKRLRPGDLILVEAEVSFANYRENQDEHMTFYGNVSVKVASKGHFQNGFWVCAPEAIREKIAAPRRKYETGDVVFHANELWFVHREENEEGDVALNNGSGTIRKTHYSALSLICPYGERADVKNLISKNG